MSFEIGYIEPENIKVITGQLGDDGWMLHVKWHELLPWWEEPYVFHIKWNFDPYAITVEKWSVLLGILARGVRVRPCHSRVTYIYQMLCINIKGALIYVKGALSYIKRALRYQKGTSYNKACVSLVCHKFPHLVCLKPFFVSGFTRLLGPGLRFLLCVQSFPIWNLIDPWSIRYHGTFKTVTNWYISKTPLI